MKRQENIRYKVSQGGDEDPRNPRKAMDIEYLLHWTYQVQAADTAGAGTVFPNGYRSNLVTIRNNGLLGTVVDCAGSASIAVATIHPDAEAVHSEVLRLEPYQRAMVLEYAKSGLRPDCFVGEQPRPVARRRPDGKPMMDYLDAKRRKPYLCLLRYDPEPDHIDMMREVWGVWHGALVHLQGVLGGLSDHVVTGPVLPSRPWLKKAIDGRGKS